jgi:hypothetical protein
MTTKIHIIHGGGNHVISGRVVEQQEDGSIYVGDRTDLLNPGDYAHFYVWGNRKLIIEEKPIDQNNSV